MFLVPAVPASLAGQGTGTEVMPGRVLSARLHAAVPESGTAGAPTEVELSYRLVADSAVRKVPLRGLAFFGLTPADLRASVGGAGVASELDVQRPPLLTGTVRLPARAAPGDTLELAISYRLPTAIPAEAGDFDVVLPLIYVDWRPAGAPEGMLQATITLPAKYSIQESFPTVPRHIDTAGGFRRYDLELQTVPSMIRFRGHEGDPPLLTFSRMVDLGVILLLAVAAGLGWKALRRERAREDARTRSREP